MADKYVKLDDIIETLEQEWGYEGMREDLEKLPTTDVVEVVRCKDCVNRVEFDTNKFHCDLTGYYCGEMGYCSDAVRTPQKEG